MGLRIVSFKIDEELLEEIDYYSNIVGLNRSEFIRLALERLIDEVKKDVEKEVIVGKTVIEPVIY
jgi:metal-responsive CopG/Arc/MetJ family transcriptional regulator